MARTPLDEADRLVSGCGERSITLLREAAYGDIGRLPPDDAFSRFSGMMPSPSYVTLSGSRLEFGLPGEPRVSVQVGLLTGSFARTLLVREVMSR